MPDTKSGKRETPPVTAGFPDVSGKELLGGGLFASLARAVLAASFAAFGKFLEDFGDGRVGLDHGGMGGFPEGLAGFHGGLAVRLFLGCLGLLAGGLEGFL